MVCSPFLAQVTSGECVPGGEGETEASALSLLGGGTSKEPGAGAGLPISEPARQGPCPGPAGPAA